MNEIRHFVVKKIDSIRDQLAIIHKDAFVSILFPQRNENRAWFRVFQRFESFSVRFAAARKNLGPDERCGNHKELVQLRYLLEEVGMMIQKIRGCHDKIVEVSDLNSPIACRIEHSSPPTYKVFSDMDIRWTHSASEKESRGKPGLRPAHSNHPRGTLYTPQRSHQHVL